MPQLFVDMDGVLANFDAHHEAVFGLRPDKLTDNIKDWKHVNEHPSFFADMPPMPDMWKLWEFVRWHNPIVLTGVPASVKLAVNHKCTWAARHLVDDWSKYKHLWEGAGGIWVVHTSAADTIRQLKELQEQGRL